MEQDVRGSFDSILREAEEFSLQRGRIHQALHDLTRRLDEAGIPYAVLDAIAMGSME